jgi:hypothetical protein
MKNIYRLGAIASLMTFSLVADSQVRIPIPYGDNYETAEEELENFDQFHQRFGIIKIDGRLTLISRSIALGQKIARDLFAWTVRRGEHARVLPRPSRSTHVEGAIEWDVTDISPRIAQQLVGTFSNGGGPNCWNLALLSSGLTRGIYGVRSEEMTLWTRSPLAHRVGLGERRLPGDMVVIRLANQEEWHAAIWVSENLVFTKNGAGEGKPYRLMDLAEMYGTYLGYPNINSPTHISVWRFDPFDQYLRDREQRISSELQTALKELREFEVQSFRFNLSLDDDSTDSEGSGEDYNNLWREYRARLRDARTRLQSLASHARVQSPNDVDAIFLWNLIDVRIGSLK